MQLYAPLYTWIQQSVSSFLHNKPSTIQSVNSHTKKAQRDVRVEPTSLSNALQQLNLTLKDNPLLGCEEKISYARSICKHLAMRCRFVNHTSLLAQDLVELSELLIDLKLKAPESWCTILRPKIQQLCLSYQQEMAADRKETPYPLLINWYLSRS